MEDKGDSHKKMRGGVFRFYGERVKVDEEKKRGEEKKGKVYSEWKR